MRRFILSVLLGAGIFGVFSGISMAGDSHPQNYPAPGNAITEQIAKAVESGNQALSGRLEAIEAKQDQIIKHLEEIKQELNIVKVRASLGGK